MNANSIQEIVTDAELDTAWGSANFGSTPKRDVVKTALLDCLGGYKTGSTATHIMKELGLVSANKWGLTKKGREYLYLAITAKDPKYDELKVQYDVNEKIALRCHDRLIDMDIENKTIKSKYDELKAENEYLNKLVDDLRQSVGSQIELTRKALAEHQALKEKSENMATALEAILNTNHDNHERVILKMKSLASDAITSYNSNTNQRSVYIGNPKGYCRDCGFPVDECNCEPNTNNQNENNG
jgi:hypothetical protein